jgi:hypothetical protein
MHKHIFGMLIKTEQINIGNNVTVSVTQIFNQDKTTSLLSNIYLSIILLYLLVT